MSFERYLELYRAKKSVIPQSPIESNQILTDTTSTVAPKVAQSRHQGTAAREWTLSVADIIETVNEHGDRSVVKKTPWADQAKAELDKFADNVVVVKRRLTDKKEVISVELRIQSDLLQSAIRDVLGYQFSINLMANPIVFDKPYYPLFHNREEIYSYAESSDRTEDEKKHLQVLTVYMKTIFRKMEESQGRLAAHGLTTFKDLKMIIIPQRLIVSQKDDVFELFYPTHVALFSTRFEITCYNWRYDGTKFGPSRVSLIIPAFEGISKIRDLDCYPLDCIPSGERETLTQDLAARGHKWRKLVDLSYMEYEGPMWKNSSVACERSHSTYVDKRIILDHETFFQMNHPQKPVLQRTDENALKKLQALPSSLSQSLFSPRPPAWGGSPSSMPPPSIRTPSRAPSPMPPPTPQISDPWQEMEEVEIDESTLASMQLNQRVPIKLRQDSILEDIWKTFDNNESFRLSTTQAMLCPGLLPCFAFKAKSWGHVLVDKVRPIQWRDDAFDLLEMDSTNKEMIKTLVNSEKKDISLFDDIIEGKGKGVVFLLHGPPGGGKTLTAEAIAEETHRPLYCMTSGELGTDVKGAETKIESTFQLSKCWNAILLIDEAEVFLAKRSLKDMQRNAFVSIFLRHLEWYEGILFLTSNRPKDFDDAIKSRIHLSLYYPPLTSSQRAKVWKNLLPKSDQQIWSDGMLNTLGERYELNGREIKNMISLALRIADGRGTLLNEEMLEMVYKVRHG